MSEELNINLKLYRERLINKYSKNVSLHTETHYSGRNRQSFQTNAPTLQSLQSKLQNYSNSKPRVHQTQSILMKQTSPDKINGMQQKIKTITTSPQVVINPFTQQLQSQKRQVPQFKGFVQSPRPYSDKSEPQLKRYNSDQDITNQIPFIEFVNMRRKLETCDLNSGNVSPTYLSEIVKLAHVINNQLQK